MCRLYGFLANEQTKVECTLVHAQNALLHQSRRDLRGESHPDGWGIGCYPDGAPVRERRASAAHEDIWFSTTAERVYSHAVVAHVRKATVGAPCRENTHPFMYHDWLFAHNGTVTAFETVERNMVDETTPELLQARHGTTDSELMFCWLLSRLLRESVITKDGCDDPQRLVPLVADAVRCLAHWCERASADERPRLNFLLTDGATMLAIRWHNSLHWLERRGIHDCEICGIPHVGHHSGIEYRAVIVASEPISQERWEEVPEHCLLIADGRIRPELTVIS